MRKINSLFVVVLLVGVVAFMAAPVFADYVATTTWNNQLDNSTFAPASLTGFMGDITAPTYGPGSIVVPYEGAYDFPGCPSVIVDDGVNPRHVLTNTTYICNTVDSTGFDAGLLINDIFSYVQEGVSDKGATGTRQGITQSLDMINAISGASGPLADSDAPHMYFSQTLDQELADLDTAGNGIYQRLHDHFSRVFDVISPSSAALNVDADGQDQTMISYMRDKDNPHGHDVLSYVAQWWQKDTIQDCTSVTSVNVCKHNEFGGHSDITGTAFTPNLTQHDP